MNEDHRNPKIPVWMLITIIGLACIIGIQANTISQLSEASINNSEAIIRNSDAIIRLSRTSIQTEEYLIWLNGRTEYLNFEMMTWAHDGNRIMGRISELQYELDTLKEQ